MNNQRSTVNDQRFMQYALTLARRGLGQTAPNPTVGCVIVKDSEIIAIGKTAKGGRPHAEAIALKKAGKQTKDATAYVTLEPCSHHGKTPPCAESLIKAGIKTVVIACKDPDARVSGNGIKMLKKAGTEVVFGVCEQEALELNQGFFKRINKGLPFVMLKAAISADGKYLEGKGKPTWITGELARNFVHKLRSQHDALITGTGTILADNPQLNVRLNGMEDYSPQVVVIGKTKLAKKKGWIYSSDSIEKTLRSLAEKGFTRVMVESGPILSNAFIKSGLVDEIIIIESPQTLGKKGKDYFLKDALKNYKTNSENSLGDDKIIHLTKSL